MLWCKRLWGRQKVRVTQSPPSLAPLWMSAIGSTIGSPACYTTESRSPTEAFRSSGQVAADWNERGKPLADLKPGRRYGQIGALAEPLARPETPEKEDPMSDRPRVEFEWAEIGCLISRIYFCGRCDSGCYHLYSHWSGAFLCRWCALSQSPLTC